MASSTPPLPAAAGWQQRLNHWGGAALDLLFPRRCAGCGRIGESFCPTCAQAVVPVPRPLCDHCGHPQPTPTARCPDCRQIVHDPLVLLRAAALHTHPLREAIHALKYEGHPELAPYLARYLTAVFAEPPWTLLTPAVDVLVPVPLHARRQQARHR